MRSALYATVAALALSAPLGACTPAQLASVSADAAKVDSALTTACNDALGIVSIAGLVPGVGAIEPYIQAGCGTAESIAKLASDPSSTQWVGTLIGQVTTLAKAAGVKVG